ncbi:MAG TPA: cytochrome c, partial [Candidatus Acidoferrales bacterium]|nr:cytochrome c [Candidatus Acidoferrales bacterium]
VVIAVLGEGCTAKRATAPPHRNQVAIGKAVFLAKCARCHGQKGEGYIGRTLVAPYDPLAGYRTADSLFTYVSKAMPFDNPGSLKEQEYWDVIAFLLDANGVLPPGTEVGKENAKMVKTTKK